VRWRKLGLLYVPDGTRGWARTHAMLPTPFKLSPDVLRLYVAHLDEASVGRISYVDVALSGSPRVLRAAEEPLLDIGAAGAFDDNGVVSSCVIPVGDGVRMYYSGFQRQKKIPYTILSGIASSGHPDGPFSRRSQVPVLDRRDGELFFRAAPYVLREEGRWRMWYIGGSGWIHTEGKSLPSYSVRHLESADGLDWSAESFECFAPRADEIGFGRPFVVRDGPLYRMWYAVRRISGYRLGYATSWDGLSWTRKDEEVGISPSQDGWDSEMIAYPAVVQGPDGWLLFYNGNAYGRTGVGVAVAEPD
jgi:hypothetical protein